MGRVLIVDDNEDIRKTLGRLVRSCGHEDVIASEGAEAIALATENPPGLVIIDLIMPGITGFDILRSLRADPRTRTVPIVVFSALSDNELVEQAISLGANDFWVKGTFNPADLENWLNYYITQGET